MTTPNKQMDRVEELAAKVTDIIFNRTAGWSERLEDAIKKTLDHQAQEVREAVVNEASEKFVRYFRARERHKPFIERMKFGKDRHMAEKLIALLRETLPTPTESGNQETRNNGK